MIARIRRFFDRVRGTDRLIFLLILGYDLYLYYGLISQGLLGLVLVFMSVGIVTGVMTAECLKKYPKTMIRVITLTGYSVMAVAVLNRAAVVFFPIWVYLLIHPMVWFWFSSQFWFVSRPTLTLYDLEHHPEWFETDEEDDEESSRFTADSPSA